MSGEEHLLFGDNRLKRLERQIFDVIKDGIIVMDASRIILEMNEAASMLTGWVVGEDVPYCSFCQNREVVAGEQRCYLMEHKQSPYLTSEMPIYSGKMLDVEMSTAQILEDPLTGTMAYVLVLRDLTERRKREAHEMRERMMRELIRAREEEHERLAKELHDGVGQSLFTISLALGSLRADVQDPERRAYIASVLDEVARLIDNVKNYSRQLRPIEIDRFGLVSALNVLVDSFMTQYKYTDFRLQTFTNRRYDNIIEINLYRIVQEALVNCVKYADAKTVEIKVFEQDGWINLLVKDDGKGFDTKDTAYISGLGLRHMEERSKALNGTFTLVSIPGHGTEIAVSVPIERRTL
ncbi:MULTISPECIES: PAS domain-containing sensor histidine kinase [Exiguobacterium]|uniref:sensor histidine kinase n=1 Tax=Exiguobacterium TaxID=33986 RepID=UPI0009F2F950|nr:MULTISPECIES: PAS domain-containing sensor histidine kinase [Exiguobacterium]TCI25372.1 PAS domain-containing sensor histidine kinase [Exiguobacterium sp. SH5S4]TCI56224.1 PAS domain-containing sensor histidine kinase [Exiguobacterium sp. SH5S13]TCI61840.1 PAS domain-containing sensor histidine kinase [Exiguobacterium sp. SH3S1]